MQAFSVNSFTNPNDQRVHQVFLGGMPITRELEDLERAISAGFDAYNQAPGHATLSTWDGDTGADAVEIARKP